MSTYDLILSIDKSKVEILLQKGILKSSTKRDIEVYEYYVNECGLTGSKMQARTNAAEKFFTSEETISRIIQRMK